MNILVIGATGFVGGHLARHLARAGHTVTGLARTDTGADSLRQEGISVLTGDLDADLEQVVTAAVAADATVYAAQLDPGGEQRAVLALLDGLAGTGKTFLFTSGTGVFLQRTAGAWSPDTFSEDTPFTVEPLAAGRAATEGLVHRAAARGVRTLTVRPGLIWGPGDHGHVSMVYRSVATIGAAGYVGDGLNCYTNVHVDDVSRLVELALARGSAGALYHAVGGEIPNRWIAESVGRDLGCATRSLTPDEAVGVWGEFGALIMAASNRSSAPRARAELGWAPTRTDMLSMIGQPRLRRLARAD